MDIQDKQLNDLVIISITGNIDALTSSQLTMHIKEHITKGNVKLIADVKGVDYTSSAGLRVLLGAVKETRALNGDMRLANIQPNVQKVLALSGFTNILKIYPDVDSAVNSFTE
ncbi:MAG: STAS domain-containing protein [Ignavibacteriaceae bacterium]